MTNRDDRMEQINRATEQGSSAILMAVIALTAVFAVGGIVYMFSDEETNLASTTTEQSSPPSTIGQRGQANPRP